MVDEVKQKLADTIEEWGAWEFAYVEDSDKEEFCTIHKEFIEQTRWSVRYRIISRHNPTGRLFAWAYDAPATEMQEGQDEYPPTVDQISEVKAVEKMVTKYDAIQS